MKIVVIQNFIHPYIDGSAALCVKDTAFSLSQQKDIQVILITTHKFLTTRIEYSEKLKIYRIYPLNIYFGFPPKRKINKFFKLIWCIKKLYHLC